MRRAKTQAPGMITGVSPCSLCNCLAKLQIVTQTTQQLHKAKRAWTSHTIKFEHIVIGRNILKAMFESVDPQLQMNGKSMLWLCLAYTRRCLVSWFEGIGWKQKLEMPWLGLSSERRARDSGAQQWSCSCPLRLWATQTYIHRAKQIQI